MSDTPSMSIKPLLSEEIVDQELSIKTLVERGLIFHRQGQLTEAKICYEQILRKIKRKTKN